MLILYTLSSFCANIFANELFTTINDKVVLKSTTLSYFTNKKVLYIYLLYFTI